MRALPLGAVSKGLQVMNAVSEDISIDELERAVFARDHERAGILLMQLLYRMASTSQAGRFIRLDGSEGLSLDEEMSVYTRIAGATLALMADPGLQLSQPGYESLIMASSAANWVFELSGYRRVDHIWRLVGTRDSSGEFRFSDQALRKALCVSSLSTLPPPMIDALERMPPQVAVPALVGLLSNNLVLSEAADETRALALRKGHLVAAHPFGDAVAANITLAWMHCSYAAIPEKHDIKSQFNLAIQRWLQSHGIPLLLPGAAQRQKRAKPVLLVVLEYARSSHAMMRCYRPSIESLRERFELVAIVEKSRIDEPVASIFDRVIHVGYPVDQFKSAVAEITAIAPDAAYFPSVGMCNWAIWLANMRLAPLQFMSLGHPATSHSTEMDFVLVSQGIRFDPACFSERVYELEGAGVAFDLVEGAGDVTALIRENPDVLKIAVPAKLFKLSAHFLRACAEIVARAGRPVEFHFFPNETGAAYNTARQRIEEAVPGALVYPRTDYRTYLSRLAECDIALGAFTFGNTNGAIDALMLNRPIVALDGPEVHQGSEQQIMRPVGLPEWLIAQDEHAYVNAVLRLVQNDTERVTISRSLDGKIATLLESERSRAADFGEAIWDLFHAWDRVSQAGGKTWSWSRARGMKVGLSEVGA